MAVSRFVPQLHRSSHDVCMAIVQAAALVRAVYDGGFSVIEVPLAPVSFVPAEMKMPDCPRSCFEAARPKLLG